MTHRLYEQELSKGLGRVAGHHPEVELLRDHSPALEFLKDESGRLVYCNRTFESVFSVDGLPLVGKLDAEWLPADAAERVRIHDQTVLEAGAVMEVEETLPTPAGIRRWLVLKFPVRSASGDQLLGAVAVDISERWRREVTLQRMAALMESSHDAVIGTSVDGSIVTWNPAATEIFGYSAAETVGRPISMLEPPDNGSEGSDLHERLQRTGSVVRFDAVRMRKDGTTVDVAISMSPIRDGGNLIGFASIARDIGERKRSEEMIIYQGFHDPLTGLANRALLMERLNLCLGKARRSGKLLAVLYLDLDLFKSVNDGIGYVSSDAVLQEIARRLTACVRDTDTVARVGGDEFVVLLPEIVRAEDAAIVAHKLLESVAEPFATVQRSIALTTSIGVSLFPDDGDDAETLLRGADNAMYSAKQRGRNNFQVSAPELSEEAIKRLDLQSGLRQALERQQLVLHYQPVLSLTSGRIVELEALVRWRHPEKGLIMPGAFIDIAEKAGLMVPLGHWVLGQASTQLKAWQENGFPELRVAINLSPSQFHERHLVSKIERALSDSSLKPETLEIEITEGVAMEDAEVTVANLMALRDMKVGISIDDFGTGYSSLSYLKKFPVTTLKIDRSFVSDVVTNSADAGIVRAVVAMAHGLKLNVIAEGVETKEQFAYLRDSGCDAMQGYWFSRPLPVEQVGALLAEEMERWRPQA
ncbi:MAG: putative bifunctional diguanylate cyclase/phosphodiesterase [Thermoanaerobaculia bacterium]